MGTRPIHKGPLWDPARTLGKGPGPESPVGRDGHGRGKSAGLLAAWADGLLSPAGAAVSKYTRRVGSGSAEPTCFFWPLLGSRVLGTLRMSFLGTLRTCLRQMPLTRTARLQARGTLAGVVPA